MGKCSKATDEHYVPGIGGRHCSGQPQQEQIQNRIEKAEMCIRDSMVGSDQVRLLIRDNGRTTKPTGKGYGLRSMDERVNNLFGDFTYGKLEDGGFFVQVDAPLIREEK